MVGLFEILRGLRANLRALDGLCLPTESENHLDDGFETKSDGVSEVMEEQERKEKEQVETGRARVELLYGPPRLIREIVDIQIVEPTGREG